MIPLFSKDLLPSNVVSDELVFRPLQLDDYEKGICDLLGQLSISNFTKEQFEERFAEMEAQKNVYYVIVCEDVKKHRLAACGTLFVEKKFLRSGGACGHVEDIVVDTSYRGKNLGLRLIEQLKHLGNKLGCYKIILDCSEKMCRCGLGNEIAPDGVTAHIEELDPQGVFFSFELYQMYHFMKNVDSQEKKSKWHCILISYSPSVDYQ